MAELASSPPQDSVQIPPDRAALFDEADRRGILPPDKKAAYEEAKRRGLVGQKAATPAADPMQRNAIDAVITPSPANIADEVLTRTQYNVKLREQAIKEIVDRELGHDPDVDYDTGLSFADRIALDQADNIGERRLYLEHRYGKDKVGADSKGRLWVKIGDKKIASETSSMAAQLLAESPELAGGAYGAMIGGEAGGPLGAIGGFALGAAAGKGTTEAGKAAAGRYQKTPKELAKTLGKTAAFGAAGEGASRALIGGAGLLTKGLPRVISGATPETEAMTAITTRGGLSGVAPPVRSALPSARTLQFHQALSEKVVGPFGDEKAQQFVDDQLKRILRRSGVPDSQVNAVFDELANPKAEVSTRTLGKDIQDSIRAQVKANETAAADTMKQAQDLLDGQMTHLNTITQRFKPGDLGIDVAEGIKGARKDFSTAAGKIYSRVDKIVGDKPLVPTVQIKRQAQRIIAALPKSDNRTVFHEIVDLPDRISFGDAQRLRTRMWEQADSITLAPGTIKGDFSKLAKATDVAINMAGLDPVAAPAVKLLKAADAWYANGIKKFEDATVNRLVRMTETGMPPDPSVIADTIIKPGYAARAEQIMRILPPDVRARVAGADFGNIITEATRTVDGKDMVQGKILANILQARGKLLDIVYGPRLAGEIRLFSLRLLARDGELPAASLKPDTFKTLMSSYEDIMTRSDAFMKENYLSVLAKSGKMPEDVLKWIVRPGQEERLEIAVKTFGENSPQIASIRQMALRDLIRRAIANTETGVGRKVEGQGLQNALASMTERQQRILFPNGLDEDLRLIADEAKFLFPPSTQGDMAAGLAAGVIKAGMPFTLPAYLYAAAWGAILSRPNVIRFLALGLQSEGPTREATRETMRTLIRAAALDMIPDTEDDTADAMPAPQP